MPPGTSRNPMGAPVGLDALGNLWLDALGNLAGKWHGVEWTSLFHRIR